VNFSVQILGSNSASFAYGRHHTSQVVNHNDNLYLVDCGEGTQIRMAKFKIRHSRINHIFISHLHGDHYLGLMGLLSTMHLQGRKHDLHVFGPSGLEDIITLQLKLSDSVLNYQIHFHAIMPEQEGVIFEDPQLEVEAICMEHRVPCHGFIFREKPKKRRLMRNKIEGEVSGELIFMLKQGQDVVTQDGRIIESSLVTEDPGAQRTYVYCADTRYTETHLSKFKEADLLYHEATFLSDMAERAGETYHSTAADAATLASKAQVKNLMIGHFSSRYKTLELFLAEARQHFPKTVLALEGETFQIGSASPALVVEHVSQDVSH
jgi:ribonuclease Z